MQRLILAAATVAAVFLGTWSLASEPRDDAVSVLSEWTPADLSGADPVALAYLAKGWLIAGREAEADRIFRELERRGDRAFGIDHEWAPFPPVQAAPNPADTVYTVTLAQVLDALRTGNRDLSRPLGLLRSMPLASNGGCFPNSAPDAPAGCVHNVSMITMAVLSHLGRDYEPQLSYALQKRLPGSTWLYWEEAPPGYWAHQRVTDAAHMAWTAVMLLDSTDDRLRAIGRDLVPLVNEQYDTKESPYFAYHAVAAMRVATGHPEGCAMADRLPEWARNLKQPDHFGRQRHKTQQWAAYVYARTRPQCSVAR
jgi:hypothetical protein